MMESGISLIQLGAGGCCFVSHIFLNTGGIKYTRGLFFCSESFCFLSLILSASSWPTHTFKLSFSPYIVLGSSLSLGCSF